MSLADPYIGVGISIVVLLGVVIGLRAQSQKTPAFYANTGDIAAIGYVCILLFTCLTDRALPNGVHCLPPYAIAGCFYFATRLLSRWRAKTEGLVCKAMVLFGLLLVITVLPSRIGSIQAANTIFVPSDLSSIRDALPFVWWSTKNDGAALLLSVLPFALTGCIVTRIPNKLFCIFCTSVAAGLSALLLLSFSRSAYVALSIVLISFGIVAVISRTVSRVRVAFVLTLFCMITSAAVLYAKASFAIVAIMRGENTTSQTRSTAGRVAIWRVLSSEVGKHPFGGNGGGADGILALKRLTVSDRPFTARSYNGPLEVLVDSGACGLVLYAAFVFYPLVTSVANLRRGGLRAYPALLTIGLFALGVHDMTDASMVTHGPTIVITWITVALLQNANSRTVLTRIRSRHWISSIHPELFAAGISCSIFVLSLHLARAESHYNAGAAAFVAADVFKARLEFGRAIQMEPMQPVFYAADALAAEEEAFGTSVVPAFWHDLPVLTRDKEKLLAAAEVDYKKSLSIAGDDATFRSDLAWTQAFRGEKEEAEKSFVEAIRCDPQDVVSRIGAGLLYERSSRTEAIEEYAHAIALSPGIVDSQFFADLRERRPDMAISVINRAGNIASTFTPSPIHLAAIAKLHAFIGAQKIARDEYTRVLGALPNLSYTWGNLALLDLQRGDRSLAHTEFQRSILLDATNRVSTNMLALMEREDGRPDDAKRLYETTLLLQDSSVHARRTYRLYYVPPPSPDDLVPQGLITYLSPKIVPLQICDRSWLEGLLRVGFVSSDVRKRILSQETLCGYGRNAFIPG